MNFSNEMLEDKCIRQELEIAEGTQKQLRKSIHSGSMRTEVAGQERIAVIVGFRVW